MAKELTEAQLKALTILRESSYGKPMTARYFAEKMWGDTKTNMFTSCKNTGNGATRGKASWLCAGSYLGKLRLKGWVHVDYGPTRYYITPDGKKMLPENK